MKNIKITYQYDGSCFYGMQRQKNKKTVQGVIEEIIKKSFFEDINLVSSGRTDRGVHAKMQISNFLLNKNIPLHIIKNKINYYSNGEIKILDIEEVDKNYNSRYCINKRTYQFILSKKENISPFENKYITAIDYDIDDLQKFNDIIKDFIGINNYSFFSKVEKNVLKNPIREIYEFYAKKKDNKIYIYICGSSFLKSMVRMMVATALKIYEGELEENYIKSRFKDSSYNGRKYIIDGNGLYLYKLEEKN